MPDIILAICPTQPGKPYIETYSNNAVSISDGEIIIGIEPVSRCISNEIVIPLQPETPVIYYCRSEDWLWWQRNKTEGDIYTDSVLEDNPTIYMKHPSCCHWQQSIVQAYQPGPVTYLIFDNGGEAFDKTDATEVVENQIYPGARLTVDHIFTDGTYTKQYEADSDTWETCCFTGGIIKEVVGNYGFPDIYYIVTCQGVDIPAKPTDFVEWAVGDWVWLIRNSSACANIARQDACRTAGDVVNTPGPPENVANIILDLVNATRASLDLLPLTLSVKLTEAATRHVNDMGANCFLSHYGSDDSTIASRIIDTGYCDGFTECSMGENVGYGLSAEHIYSLWLESPSHYANITDPNWLEMGIASYNIECSEVYDEINGTVNNVSAVGVIAFAQEFGNRGVDEQPPEEETELIYSIVPAAISA